MTFRIGSLIRPSYQTGFARNADESARPQDWKGLIGLWLPFLGPSGLTLRDWSGRGQHGTLTSMDPATDWVISERGYTLDFDGTDYIALSAPSSSLSEVTICAWINSNTTSNNQGILGNNGNFLLFQLDSDRLKFWQNTNVGGGESATFSYSTGEWMHVATTFTNTGHVNKYYLNGVDISNTSGTADIGSNAGLNIATWQGTSRFFNGFIDDVRIYNRVLSPRQVLEIYQDPFGIVRFRFPFAGFHSIQDLVSLGSWQTRTGRRGQMGRGMGRGR